MMNRLMLRFFKIFSLNLLILLFPLFTLAIPNIINLDNTAIDITNKCNDLSQKAVKDALTAYKNAKKLGLDARGILTIVDYSKPATENRLCTVDLKDKNILYSGVVAHGVNSGGEFATQFSNNVGSNESSLGLFLTGEPYYGVAGHSLTLYGLDKGLNDNALARHVVMHGLRHDIKKAAVIKPHMKVAHTLGCFGINKKHVDEVIDHIKGGTLLFAYYPSTQLTHSVFLTKSDSSTFSFVNI